MNSIIEEKYSNAVSGLNETILLDANKWYDYINNLPIDQQIIYTVSILNWQVRNGGFHQYFFNSYGMFVFLTLKNLEELKLFEIKDILKKALILVNIENLSDEDFRLKIFDRKIKKITDFNEELFQALNNLDNLYYSISEQEIINSFRIYLKMDI